MNDESLSSLYMTVDWSATDWTERDDVLPYQMLSLLDDLPGCRILDLGCGSASLGVELAERGYDVTCLDLYVQPARERAAARRAQIRFVEQDMSEMAFAGEFDAVINWDVSGIGLKPTDEDNIDIVRRVYDALVPGGKFLIETYNLAFARQHGIDVLTYDGASGRCIGDITRTLVDGCQRTWNLSLRLFSIEEWRAILCGLGFSVLGVWGSRSKTELSTESKMLVILAQKP